MQKIELHTEITESGQFAIDVLSEQVSLSKQQIKTAISKGALWLSKGKSTQRFRRIKKAMVAPATLHFYYDEQVLSQQCEPAELIADHQDYSVWYKPYGMLSHGSKWSDHLTITRFVQQYFKHERACLLVHRLDRAASGIIVVAHTKKATRLLAQLFEHHQLTKVYHILAHGNQQLCPQPQTVTIDIDGKKATSHFRALAYQAEHDVSLIEVIIESGRKHQIRKHATAIGFPVVGDRLHGDESRQYPESLNLQLCAAKLSFVCPIKQQLVSFQCPEQHLPSFDNLSE